MVRVLLVLISELLFSLSIFVLCGAEQFIDHEDVRPMVSAANAIYGYAEEMNDHEDKQEGWDVIEYDFKSTKLEGFDLLWCSKADVGDNTRACMAQKGKTLMLFFRGTNKTPAPEMKMINVNNPAFNWKKKARADVEIHKEFMDALFTRVSGSIWYADKRQSQRYSGNNALRLMDWVQESIDVKKPTKILVTGHSLGGALAQVAATYIAHTNIGTKVMLTTYGSPRVGDKGYKEWFYKLRNLSTQRYVFREDPIPRSNRFGGIHTGHLVQIVDEHRLPETYWRQDGCQAYDDESQQDLCVKRFNYKAAGSNWYYIGVSPSHNDIAKYVPYVKKKE